MGENMIRQCIIDTDTASDDAVALIMAMRHPGVQIEAITVVAGNVPVDQAVQNALYTVEAWKIFIKRLKPGGIFTVSRWFNSINPNETFRAVGLAVASMLAVRT